MTKNPMDSAKSEQDRTVHGAWIASWTAAQQLCEPQNLPPEPFVSLSIFHGPKDI